VGAEEEAGAEVAVGAEEEAGVAEAEAAQNRQFEAPGAARCRC